MSGSEERLLRLLQEARSKLEVERLRRREPIAVIGMACRFPGAENQGAYWELLSNGRDATREVPGDRWDVEALYDPDASVPGKCYVKRGGFLEDIAGFDADFFGISPREAQGLDPQQRLLLETTWEAIEDARVAADTLRGTNTGVWVGLSLDDYSRRSITSGQLARIDPYSALGNARSIAAGRIAYVLDLHGPVLQLDTACSSSLVALHLACQSLRAGECQMAIVGGVNVLASPETTVALCKLQALSRDGRCKTFDAGADGYGRGEGCGVVILERLSDARARRDPIRALIPGTAINHDGRSNGLTAPNGRAQEAVLRAALANASLGPLDIDFVEAHGTGTLLGDPIEVMALSRVYGAGRPREVPLLLGSVKTNVGHLEGAAGLAGFIKAVLCLEHRTVVPHLHLERPNPNIPWAGLPLRVPTALEAWPSNGRPRRAAVSSFGISGTNAHVLVEEAPAAEARPEATLHRAELIVLSAGTPAALEDSAHRLLRHLERHPELPLSELAYSSMTTRSTLGQRASFVVSSPAALRAALAAGTRGATAAGPHEKLAFVFSGQGSQWLGMGRECFETERAFRAELEQCDAAIRAEAGWSVLEEVHAVPDASSLDRIERVQPLLFALQVSLAALWRSWGVEPNGVVGHSLGEAAAAYIAGALSLSDAAAVICRRSQLLKRIGGRGAMAQVELTSQEAEARLRPWGNALSVAVVNGVRSTVVAGEPAALTELLRQLEAEGVYCRAIKVDVASHSPQVDPLLDELQAALAGLLPAAAMLPMYSTVTCELVAGTELGARYWADNLRRPVRFADVVRELCAAGFTRFLEVSPHPLLVPAVEEIGHAVGVGLVSVGSLRREQPERATLLGSLGALYAHGHPLRAEALFAETPSKVALPTYPWQRRRFWLDAPPPAQGSGQSVHPLLGCEIARADVDAAYESRLSVADAPWLGDHRIRGHCVLPASALLEMARAAAEHHLGQSVVIRNLVIERPLFISDRAKAHVQVLLTEGARRVSIHARSECAGESSRFTLHAAATAEPLPAASVSRLDLRALRSRCSDRVDVSELRRAFSDVGIDYGPTFSGLRSALRGCNEVLAEVSLPDVGDAASHALHPALLDAAFQALAGVSCEPLARTLLPAEIGDYSVQQAGARLAFVHARLAAAAAGDALTAHVTLADTAGEVIANVGSLQLRAADVEALLPRSDVARLVHRLEWAAVSLPESASVAPVRSVLLASGSGLAQAVITSVAELTQSCEVLSRAELGRLGPERAVEHVIVYWDVAVPGEGSLRAAIDALGIVRALVSRGSVPRLWWITRRAIAVGERDAVQPAAATLWGLGRTVAQEHPDLRCTLLDVDDESAIGAALAAELQGEGDETQVAYREGRRHVARLARVPAQVLSSSTPSLAPSRAGYGSVFIVGGLGGLGLEVARHYAAAGAKHLILAGRRGLDTPGARAAVAELAARASTTEVTVAPVDAADFAALSAVIEAVPADAPLDIVVHAAAVLDDGLLSEQTPERFEAVLSPKVLGAWNLHLLTRELPVRHFVLFSSLAGTLGSAAQGAYAAANTFLDALAAHRRSVGLAGVSLAWGPWAERGLAAQLSSTLQGRLARQGIGRLSLGEGLEVLDRALGDTRGDLVVAALDVNAAARHFGANVPSVWRALVRRPASVEAATSRSFVAELSQMTAAERLERCVSAVRAEVARILLVSDAAGVPLDRPLRELGFDSLMALELRNALSRRGPPALSATLVFKHPSVRAVAAHWASQLGALGAGALTSRPERDAVAQCEALGPLEAPQARLFCFHDAGGSPGSYVPFQALSSAGIEVHAISHTRGEPPNRAAALRYLEEASRYIEQRADRPYALFGHSLGGFFAWRVAQELQRGPLPAPAFVAASASVVPAWLREDGSDEALREAAQRVARRRSALPAAFEEEFVADASLWRAMPRAEARLKTRIFGFLGAEDDIASAEGMAAWAERTAAGFSLMSLPGGHFYLFEDGPRRILLDALARLFERA